MARRSDIDWEMIERDYRIGVLTTSMLVTKHKVSKATICRRASKHNWTRDLSEQVQALTKAKVNVMIVAGATELQQKRDRTDAFEVKSQASINSAIVMSHQHVAKRNTELLNLLTQQLTEQIKDSVTMKELLKLVREQHPSAMRELHKAMSLSNHVSILKQITELHSNIIKVERQAYNIDAEEKQRVPALERAIFAIKSRPDYQEFSKNFKAS